MIVYLWAEASRSPRRAEAGVIFRGQSVKRDFHEKSTFFFFASFLCEEKTNNLQPRICGRSAVRWRAMLSERENHFSSRLTCNLSFLSSFHCVFLSRLFCQSFCGLLYLVFSPSPWYFVLSSFESNFVLWFFYCLKDWGIYKPDKRIFCEMCCTESFGLNRKLNDVIGRAGLFYVILNLIWSFFFMLQLHWASVLCRTCHVSKTSITRAEKHSCTDTRWPLGLGDYILNIHYIFARNYFNVLF